MDLGVRTADGQSAGLKVLGLGKQLKVLGDMGEQWPIYLEGMERCYMLEPLVIQGLSHCVNLGLAFLQAQDDMCRGGGPSHANLRQVDLQC